MADKTISISFEEYTRLKDIERGYILQIDRWKIRRN